MKADEVKKKTENYTLELLIRKRTFIDDRNSSETSVTGNLPQLNDLTMISVGTKVMVMLLLQYSQWWYAQDQLEA